MKKLASIVAGVVLVALAFNVASAQSVHSNATNNKSSCKAKGTISYMYWGDKGEQIEQQAAVKQVEQQCPGIKVNQMYTPNNYDTLLANDIGSGNAPTVFQLDAGKRIPEFVATDHALTNLSPYAKADKFSPGKIYWPACAQQGYYKGNLYGLMRDCSNQAMVLYNKDMFKARGVKAPTNSWTLATLKSDA